MPIIGGSSPGAGLPSGGTSGVDVLINPGVWSAGARLAQPGQTPAQEPLAAQGKTGFVGVSDRAMRADAVAPLPLGLGGHAIIGRTIGAGIDISLGATRTPASANSLLYDHGLLNGSLPTLTGSTYSYDFFAAGHGLYCHDFNLAAGYTLRPTALGDGLLLVCTGTLTVGGTITTAGESPAAGAAVTQGTTVINRYRGQAGASGGTGAGATAPTMGNVFGVGGLGGLGGSSGASAGGATSPGNVQANLWPGLDAFLLLMGAYGAASQGTAPGPAAGGTGGGAGAGDGTNKGGSGGSGAGNLIIVARKVVLTSTAVLRANGGDGAPGAGGNAAGGGPGGPGVVAVHCLDLTLDPAAVLQAQPGTPGAGSGSGLAGSAGAASTRFYDSTVAAPGYGHNFGAGVLLNVWQ